MVNLKEKEKNTSNSQEWGHRIITGNFSTAKLIKIKWKFIYNMLTSYVTNDVRYSIWVWSKFCSCWIFHSFCNSFGITHTNNDIRFLFGDNDASLSCFFLLLLLFIYYLTPFPICILHYECILVQCKRESIEFINDQTTSTNDKWDPDSITYLQI